MQSRICINVYGIVQGVGFRPHIYRLAVRLNLVGSIRNDSNGISIEIQGNAENLDQFIHLLNNQPPPLALITDIQVKQVTLKEEHTFKIIRSEQLDEKNTLISPDIALCDDCLHELLSHSDRRYFYPFINCTNCGPRYTIISDIPYDRRNSSMVMFKMCPQCQSEYDDPNDRRFHAQPNACPDCGPHVKFTDNNSKIIEGNAIQNAISALESGAIVAIKGLGGFHLAVDAINHGSVSTLRKRKHRFEKPLAVMVADLNVGHHIAHINEQEEMLLSSLQRPIVLCRKKEESQVSPHVSLDNAYFGLMLPYTPLHKLIFENKKLPILVMTSANISEEPICYQNEECINRLGKIADYFLIHNRDIISRCDDSVLRIFHGKSFFIRRSRGYAPRPILLNKKGESILAVGGHLKNTICFTKDRFAFMSQHIGDLENVPTLDVFEETMHHMMKLFEINPCFIVHDLHPDYLSSKWVQGNAIIPYFAVQHHYAHILSVMAEKGIEDDILGFSLDGAGYGSDGTIWGGEVLICNLKSFQRYAHFETRPMPGGEKAIQEPWRMAVSYLVNSFGLDSQILNKLFPDRLAQIDIILQMISKGLNSPLTSSCGRLFDAVAAILGLPGTVSYEGQSAIQLESLAEKADQDKDYHIGEFLLVKKSDKYIIDMQDIIYNIVSLRLAGEPDFNLSKAFHTALIKVFSRIAIYARHELGIKRIALSGGCFQNMILLSGLSDDLKQNGFEVYTNHQVPVNDGGLALGQAYWGMHNCDKNII